MVMFVWRFVDPLAEGTSHWQFLRRFGVHLAEEIFQWYCFGRFADYLAEEICCWQPFEGVLVSFWLRRSFTIIEWGRYGFHLAVEIFHWLGLKEIRWPPGWEYILPSTTVQDLIDTFPRISLTSNDLRRSGVHFAKEIFWCPQAKDLMDTIWLRSFVVIENVWSNIIPVSDKFWRNVYYLPFSLVLKTKA